MKFRSFFIASILLILSAQPTLAESGHWAFEFPADQNTPNAVLDLRYLNEDVAGQHGFITRSADGNSFVRGDGQPIRFWGVTPRLEFGALPIDSLRGMARFYAKMGINMVRIHTQISPKTPGSQITDFDSTEIDHIQKIVAAFKDAGIYLTISPYWPSSYFLKHVSKTWGIDGYSGEQHLWNVLFFNEKLQAGYKAWVRALYTGDNPYTGVLLKDEPAVAIIQIQNEDGMFWWTVDQLKPPQKQLLEQRFSTFVTGKYGSCAAALTAWEHATIDDDAPDAGFVKLYPTWELTVEQTGGKAVRIKDQTEFLATLQYNFYKDITDYYHRDLGCKQLVNPGNWFTASMGRLNDLERWTYTGGQVMAVNRYFSPGHIGENSGWRIDPGHYYEGKSVMHNPASLISNIVQPEGFPFIISEGGWNLPSQNLAEAPFMTAAYQSLTGVDGLFWYTTRPPGYDIDPYVRMDALGDGQLPLRRWSIAVPQVLGLFPANALMFRMGYIREGLPVVRETTNLKALTERNIPAIVENSGFDPNRMDESQGQNNQTGMAVNPLAFAAGPVQIDLQGARQEYTACPELPALVNMDNKIVNSITGELSWDYGKGKVTLNTPKAQGVCGFNTNDTELADVSVHCRNDYAAIQVVSLDDQPIAESKKLLVQIGTRAIPTEWQQEPAEFGDKDKKVKGFKILNTGHMPWQIENTQAVIEIGNSGLSQATLLDAAMVPVRVLNVTRSKSGIRIELPAESMYVIVE